MVDAHFPSIEGYRTCLEILEDERNLSDGALRVLEQAPTSQRSGLLARATKLLRRELETFDGLAALSAQLRANQGQAPDGHSYYLLNL